ncbi:hypothetical protein [Lysobacter panacisoli]|uniref:Secreted protein n=1 Tax=Lysobacter panacisoli TaxID=1255263 RepID=A0ABP9LBB6_9GAMM|nr:hypothetical protein [Lysobacter panacisoli]
MNRRLQNSFTAMLASASALALCLSLAMPSAPQQHGPVALNLGPVEVSFTPDDPAASREDQVEALVRSIEARSDRVESLADAATLTAEIAAAAALAGSLHEARDNAKLQTETKARTAARHRRQTLVMPYFSFAPRG